MRGTTMKKSIRSILYIIPLFAIAVFLSSCDSNVTDSNGNLATSELSSDSNIEIVDIPETIAYSQPIGRDTLTVSDTGNPAGSGSVKVTYENESVTIYYQSSWTPQDVAATLNYYINNDPDIDLTSTLSYSNAEVRLAGYGTSTVVYVTHTNGTHITVTPYLAVLQD